MDSQGESDGPVDDIPSRAAVQAQVAELKRVEVLLWAVIGLLVCVLAMQGFSAGRRTHPGPVVPPLQVGAPAVQEVRKVSLTALDQELRPNPLAIGTGEVEFVVTNKGSAPYGVGVEGQNWKVEAVAPGVTASFRAVVGPGVYTMWLRDPAGRLVARSKMVVE